MGLTSWFDARLDTIYSATWHLPLVTASRRIARLTLKSPQYNGAILVELFVYEDIIVTINK